MKKHLLIFFLLVSQLGWAQTEVKREVFGRDIGQLIGIRFTGRIIDEITEEALVDQLPTQMASLIIQETILLNSKKEMNSDSLIIIDWNFLSTLNFQARANSSMGIGLSQY